MGHGKLCTLLLTLIFGVLLTAQVTAAPLYGTTTSSPSSPSDFYTIDPTTGVATFVGAIGFNRVGALEVDQTTGIIYAAAQRPSDDEPVIITIDPLTGIGTELGPHGMDGGGATSDLSFRSDGVLFALDAGNTPEHKLYTIDLTTGAGTFVGSIGLSVIPGNATAFDAANTLYHVAFDGLYTLDQTTGASTFDKSLTYPSGGDRLAAMDFHPTAPGNPARSNVPYAILKGGSSGDELVTVDIATGIVTTVGVTEDGMDGLAWGLLTADERLPVELASFNLSSRNGNVMLSWQTASEIDNAGFEVQRADTDSSFKTITSYLNNASLVGLGTSSHGKSYRYTDGGDGALQAGRTYLYRLVNVSREGVRNAHSAVSVRIEAADVVADQGALRLYPVSPNPVQDFAQISFSMRDAGSVRVEVYTVDGRPVATPIAGSYGVGDHAETLSLQGLSAGSYTLVLTANHSVRTQRLVVVR